MANRKQGVERFIVAEGNQAITNVANAGSNLYDLATKKYLLADKQIGIVYMDNEQPTQKDLIVDVVSTASDLLARKIQLVQGTSLSATSATNQSSYGTTGYDVRVMRSGVIDLDKPIRYIGTGILSRNERTSGFWVTGFTANDDQKYKLKISASSPYLRRYMSQESYDCVPIEYTTPNYTALSTTSPIDHLYKNLGLNALRESQIYTNGYNGTFGVNPYAVFAIGALAATGGGSPGTNGSVTINGTAYVTPSIANLISGFATSITVAVSVTPSGVNSTIVFTPDIAFREMLQAAVTAGKILASDRIVIMSTTGAGASTTVNCAKGLLFTGITPAPAMVWDETEDERLTTVTVTSDTSNGSGADLSVASRVQNAEGKGSQYKIQYLKDAQGDQYSQQIWGGNFDFVPKYVPVTVGKFYTVYCFEHEQHEKEYNDQTYSTGEVLVNKTYLLVESAAPAIATGGVTGATTRGNLTTYLKPILDLATQKLGFTSVTFN